MRKRKNRRPRRLSGRIEERSLLLSACRAFVDNYANLLRFGLIVGGLYLVSVIPERMATSPQSTAFDAPSVEDARVEENTDTFSDETFLTDGVLRAMNCTRREYQRENYSECDIADSEVYSQDEIFKDDGSRSITVFDVERLYADAK